MTGSATCRGSPRGCPPRRPRRRRALDHAVLPLAAARPRLRRGRLPRRRPALRHPRRLRHPHRPRPRPRPEADRRPRAQPHLRRARLVPGGAGAGPGTPERDRYLFRTGRGRRRGAAQQLGSPCSAARPGPGSTDTDSGTSTSSTPPSPTSTGATPRSRRLRGRPAVLARPRRRRVPRRRGARAVQGGGAARPGPAEAVRACQRHRPRDGEPRAGRRADVGPARGARRLPALAPDPRRVRRRPDGRRRGLVADRRSDGAVRASRRAPADLQLRAGCWRRGRRRPSARSSPPRWPPSTRCAPRRPGCCPTTTWSGTPPATAAARRAWRAPGRPRWRCWRCPARPTSTRARSSASSRSTSRRRTGRTRVVPHRRGRPRRLPGADPVGRRRPAVRLRAGHDQPWLPQPDDWAALTVEAQSGPTRLDAGVLPGALAAPRGPRGRRGRRRRAPRPRRATCSPSAADRVTVVSTAAPRPSISPRARSSSPAERSRTPCLRTRPSGCAEEPLRSPAPPHSRPGDGAAMSGA